MSEEFVCKKSRIDKSITKTCKLIKCLLEPLNTNQFVAALLYRFFDSIVIVFNHNYDDDITLYMLIESLFKYFQYLYSEKSEDDCYYNEMSIEEFTNFVRSPLLFFDNISSIQDFKECYDLQDDYIHVMLRFFETFVLFEFIGAPYHYECEFRSFEDDSYKDFVNRFCEYVCESKDDNLWYYVEQVHEVVESMDKIFTKMFISISSNSHHVIFSMDQASLLNEIQYVLHQNPDVHPRVKHALHFCL